MAAVTVKSPMTADLDAAGHNISNVLNLTTPQGASLAGTGVTVDSLVLMDDLTNPTVITLDFATTADPSVAPPLGNNPAGSTARRKRPDGRAELWFKFGPNATDWQKVAG